MTHVTSDVTTVTTKMAADDKYAHASMLFAIVTANLRNNIKSRPYGFAIGY